MLIHHVKGYPDPSMYGKNKGRITFDTNRATPCIMKFMQPPVLNLLFHDPQLRTSHLEAPFQVGAAIQ